MKNEQPKIEKGRKFIGWATFNWGVCYHRVYRTRKEAMAACIGTGNEGSTWDDVKDHFRVVKVECTVQ
jgi:hypothetical protein